MRLGADPLIEVKMPKPVAGVLAQAPVHRSVQ
jgi:hypothetical protein